jgi:wyosine [tRNA(Phe)-imidazoG37] synthetase (radical SAM superfamily)
MRCVYGPVPSGRLGVSLGVDVIPRKTCSYDCIYCQLGRTTDKTTKRDAYLPVERIIREIKDFLDHMKTPVDYITFSGSKTVYGTINRPEGSLEINQVIEGIREFRARFRGQIWVEILYCRGMNNDRSEVARMKEILEQINPDRIQLNTVYRPPAEDFASPLTEERLSEIKEVLGGKVSVITPYRGNRSIWGKGEVEAHIVDALKRRPLTADDMSESLGLHAQEIVKFCNLFPQ